MAVLGFVELDVFLGPGVVCGRLPTELTDRVPRSLPSGYGADLAIPNMGQIGQECMLPVYAPVGAEWRSAGRHMLVHSRDFAQLATDKVLFHGVAQQRRWPVPRGAACNGPSDLLTAAAIGLPALVKEARSEPFFGRHYVPDRSALRQVCREVRLPVLLQTAVEGEEFAVELLSTPSGTIIWPVASMGQGHSGHRRHLWAGRPVAAGCPT